MNDDWDQHEREYQAKIHHINIIFGTITALLVMLCLGALFYAAVQDGRRSPVATHLGGEA